MPHTVMSEVATRFVDDAAADKLRAKGCVELHGELGSVLVARGMEYDNSVELGLRSFFGAKDRSTQQPHALACSIAICRQPFLRMYVASLGV